MTNTIKLETARHIRRMLQPIMTATDYLDNVCHFSNVVELADRFIDWLVNTSDGLDNCGCDQ